MFKFKSFSYNKIIVLAIIFISTTIILDWIFNNNSFFISQSQERVVKFNTALLFLLLSFGLLIPVKRNLFFKSIKLVQIATILLVASLTLLEYFFNQDFGIDNFFVVDTDTSSFPGRMSQASALCFLLIGVADTWIQSENKFFYAVSRYSLLIIVLISFLAIAGHIVSANTESTFSLDSMAVLASVFFLFLSFAIFLNNPLVTCTKALLKSCLLKVKGCLI